jgi:outer membrane translocation and assembly module TamA
MGDWKLLKIFDIDWWQFVPFVEVGRVAPKWDIADLHSDLKWDAGLGVRLMVMKAIVRLDTAVSDETWGVWAMVGQPF